MRDDSAKTTRDEINCGKHIRTKANFYVMNDEPWSELKATRDVNS